ncbi:MAG: GNAT family N-acetyltransferase [Bacteroidota bacterium]
MFAKGKNISLRAIEPEDIDALYRWENDLKLWHVSETLIPFSKFILKEYIQEATRDIFDARQLRLIIAENEDGTSAGAIDLFDYDPLHRRAGVGLLIQDNHRHKGYAAEALELIKHYAFNTLMLHQLYCQIGESNQKSMKLFTKAGFEITGKKKEWLKYPEGWENVLFLQLLK